MRSLLAVLLFAALVACAVSGDSTGSAPAVSSSTGAAPAPAMSSSATPPPPAMSSSATPPPPAMSSSVVPPPPPPASSSAMPPTPPSSTGVAPMGSSGVQPTAPPMSSSAPPAPMMSSTGGAMGGSVCDRIVQTNGLNPASETDEYQVMVAYVTSIAVGVPGTVGLFANAATAPFFDGSINYRNTTRVPGATFIASPFAATGSGFIQPNAPAYSAVNNTALATLVNHLALFFGNNLGCSATKPLAFPTYSYITPTSPTPFTMYTVHSNMGIDITQFTAFNSIVTGVATYYNTSSDDVNTINGFLNTFLRNNAVNTNSICTDSTCTCFAGLSGANCDQLVGAASSTSVSIISILVAAFVAVIAIMKQ